MQELTEPVDEELKAVVHSGTVSKATAKMDELRVADAI